MAFHSIKISVAVLSLTAFVNIIWSTNYSLKPISDCDEAANPKTLGLRGGDIDITFNETSKLSDQLVLSYLKERKLDQTVIKMEEEILLHDTGGDQNQSNPKQDDSTAKNIEMQIQPSKTTSKKQIDQSETKAKIATLNSTIDSNALTTNFTSTSEKSESTGSESGDTGVAWSNLTTIGLYEGRLDSGFRNQMMAVSVLIFEALKGNNGQVLMDTIKQKDTFGSNKLIPFHKLWDVPHWNSYYPKLPRLVHYDPNLHDQINPEGTARWYRHPDGNWTDRGNVTIYKEPSRPRPFGRQHNLMNGYFRYVKGRGPYTVNGHRNDAEILMHREAMRPHPKLQAIIDQILLSLKGNEEKKDKNNNDNKVDYITLHARVEPDMQEHKMCWDKKVLNLTDIFDWMEAKWPDPPAKHVFMPINRKLLEKAASKKNPNEIAVNNLKALNKARDEGLWNGRAKVFECGSKAMENTEYAKTPLTPAALVDYFMGIGGKIFIGTEVSSFSHDLLATRFFRNMTENYYYLPDGLHHWTPPGLEDPPGFKC